MASNHDANQTSLHWSSVNGSEPPKALSGILLDAAIAYEQQCKQYGSLSLPDRKRLHKLARSGSRESVDSRTSASKSAVGSSPPQYAFGTQFVREWQGRDEIVTATEDGFLWDGQTYKSLSAVARAITGTRWNGPRFFGVDTKRKAR